MTNEKIDLRLEFTAETKGNGYWSRRKARLSHETIRLITFGPDEYGELRVAFSTNVWDTAEHGLIYTDSGWITDLRAALTKAGLSPDACEDVSYSEQGMQGDSFVSLDVGPKFIAEARAKLTALE